MRSFFCTLFLLFSFLGLFSPVEGRGERPATHYSVQEHYDLGCQDFENGKWDDALVHFTSIAKEFDESPFYLDAVFHCGACYFKKSEFDLANKQFDRYLTLGGKLKHFEMVFDYKLEIANQFAAGIKKHLFGFSKLPKWAPAKGDALALYDEIVSALPGKDIAAIALYNKADLQLAKKQYEECISDLQALCRRFPKHSLAADSYLLISKIYLSQSRLESQNPDFLSLAQVNIQRFAKNFPSDERVELAKKQLLDMQEVYAQSLYDTGRFYERVKKPNASIIYYEDAVRKYPETQAARNSEQRLAKLATP